MSDCQIKRETTYYITQFECSPPSTQQVKTRQQSISIQLFGRWVRERHGGLEGPGGGVQEQHGDLDGPGVSGKGLAGVLGGAGGRDIDQ